MAAITSLAMTAGATGSDQWLHQPFSRGAGVFAGRITSKGERLFYFRYTASDGRRRYLQIGSFHAKGLAGGVTVAEASKRAAELSRLYVSGVKDLREHFEAEAAAKIAAKEADRIASHVEAQSLQAGAASRLTVRQLFERWCATELQPTIRADGKRAGRKDGGAYIREQFERHVFPAIESIPVVELRKADLLALIDAQKARSRLRTAAILMGDLRQMLGFAVDRDLIPFDPLASVKKARIVGVSVERERTLSEEELAQLAQQLPGARMHTRSATAIWLLLATGARVGELMGAVWADTLPDSAKLRQARIDTLQAMAEADGAKVGVVDLDAATWHLPDTKNQRAHTIHLSAFALQNFIALRDLREAGGDEKSSPWVFSARDADRPVCVKSFGKQLSDRQRPADKRMVGRSKATESLSLSGGRWTAHDLRRTAATMMASLGTSGDVIDECLNHMIESRVRRTYIRDRRLAEQAVAFDSLGAQLSALLGAGRPQSTELNE